MRHGACLGMSVVVVDIMTDVCEQINATNIQDFYALHNQDMRKQLQSEWSGAFFKSQPVEDIRDYFGSKIAIYFLWLQRMYCCLLCHI